MNYLEHEGANGTSGVIASPIEGVAQNTLLATNINTTILVFRVTSNRCPLPSTCSLENKLTWSQ